ncbi:DUF932-domain-containing protein, partial [Zopfia rhizophila CBS 207.26]
MRDAGFLPMAAGQARTRDEGRRGHTKHMLRFRHADVRPMAEHRVGQTFPEIVLLNSHDGTSAYRVMSGVFRLVCLNGMIVADREGAEVRVPHKGDVVRQVVEGSYAVLDDARRALEAAEAWQGVALNRDEQRAFGEAARVLRFGDAEGRTETPITAEQLLAPRRVDDAGDDLWRTFNRVQENAIRGGLTAWGRDAQNRPRRVTSREVTGIDGDRIRRSVPAADGATAHEACRARGRDPRVPLHGAAATAPAGIASIRGLVPRSGCRPALQGRERVLELHLRHRHAQHAKALAGGLGRKLGRRLRAHQQQRRQPRLACPRGPGQREAARPGRHRMRGEQQVEGPAVPEQPKGLPRPGGLRRVPARLPEAVDEVAPRQRLRLRDERSRRCRGPGGARRDHRGRASRLRQPERRRRAPAWLALQPQRAARLRREAAGHRQPEPGAAVLRLGGEEGFRRPRQRRRVHADPGVGGPEPHVAPGPQAGRVLLPLGHDLSRGAEGDLAASGRHRVPGIDRQVDQHRLELPTVRPQRRQPGRRLDPQPDPRPEGVAEHVPEPAQQLGRVQ